MNGFVFAALLCFCTVVYLPSVKLISSDLLQYGLCNTATYARNSSFADNLQNFYTLLTAYSRVSFSQYVTAVSNLNSTSDNAYGFFQCRGDVSLADCSSCISFIVNSAFCSTAIGAGVQLQGCYLRYENYDFFLLRDYYFVHNNCTASSSTATASFRANLASVLNATAKAAASAAGGFYSSSRGSGDDTAYALAQCLAYLSPSQCVKCLRVSNYNTLCPNAVAGVTFYSTCYYLYSNVAFKSTLGIAPTPGLVTPPPVKSAPPRPTSTISAVGVKNSTLQESRKAGSKRTAIVGTVVGAILLAVLCSLLLLSIERRRKSSRHGSEFRTDIISILQNIPAYSATKFSLNELRKATNNFHSGHKLGEGGFGPVYKGRLPNETEVAVKMLSIKSHQGTEQFMNEVSLITTVQHRNLVELLGYCIDESKRILVYEYLPYRSLDVHLFGQGEETIFLNWRTRYDIIIGIACGLQYLHEDSHVKIVHRDIKTSNILLDNNLNPKIADFGLARFFQDDVTHVTTRVAGTMGYLAPEYVIGGQLTEKVDVYSFGLVALEILSGMRIMDERLEQLLLDWTWTLYEKRQQLQILDPKLVGQPIDPGEVIRIVHVALLCTQLTPRARPTMSKVFTMLCNQSEILELPTKPLLIDTDVAQCVVVPRVSSSRSLSANPSHLPISNTSSKASNYVVGCKREDKTGIEYLNQTR